MPAQRPIPCRGGIVALLTIVVSLTGAGQALAATKVRFLHALPGGPTADLELSGGSGPQATLSDIGFGKVSEPASGPSGPVTVTLTAGGKRLASTKENLADGASYTIVVRKGSGDKPRFQVFRGGRPVAGKASVRAVNVAPELGRVTMAVGGRDWGTVAYGQDTGYKSADPGTYDLTVSQPGKKSALVTQKGVTATAGTAATAYAVGSGGERTRFVLVADSAAAPVGGPDTGLGGISGQEDMPWLAALLAALAAGAAGGLVYTRVARGRVRT